MIGFVLFFCVVVSLLAQQPGVIRGVVSSTTGQPLRKAEVTIRSGSNGEESRGLATMTDGSGRFAFEGIPPGGYIVSASRIGFVSQKAAAIRNVKLGPGESLDAPLTLAPQSVISGRVTDEDGDPLFGATVSLIEETFIRARPSFTVRVNASTNDLGEYRMPGLSPGRYHLAVDPPRQIGPSPIRVQQQGQRLGAVPTFYPSAFDLQAGQEVRGMDVQVRRLPVFNVYGRLLDASGNPARGIDITVLSGSNAAESTLGLNRAIPKPDGSFVVHSIPAGSYVLQARTITMEGQATAMVNIQVGSRDLEDLVVRVSPPATVTGVVRAEDNANVQNVRVTLEAIDAYPFDLRTSDPVGPGNSFSVNKMGLGRYLLSVYGVPDGYYLKSVLLNGEDVTEKGLMVNGDVSGVDISLAKGAVKLEGSLSSADGTKLPTGGVVLVPEESKRGRWSLFQLAVTDQTGAFAMRNVPPGEYQLFGFTNGEDAASIQNPEVLKRLEPKAKTLKIGGSATQAVELKVVD